MDERIYHDTFVRYPCVFGAALHAADFDPPDTWNASPEEAYPELLRGLVANQHVENFPFGDEQLMLTEAFRNAQIAFAMIDCRAPRHEDSLTGSLQSRLSSAAIWTNKRWKDVDPRHQPLHLWAVELILEGSEQELGADLAFVIEINGRLLVTCFQTKRLLKKKTRSGGKISIAQPRAWEDKDGNVQHGDPGWQLRMLSELEEDGDKDLFPMNPGYLFYDNAEGGIRHPILPVLKSVRAFDAGEKTDLVVKLREGTSDLASFIGSCVRDSSTSRLCDPESMRMMVGRLVRYKWRRIICVTSAADFEWRFKLAVEQANVGDVNVQANIQAIFEGDPRPEPCEFDVSMSSLVQEARPESEPSP